MIRFSFMRTSKNCESSNSQCHFARRSESSGDGPKVLVEMVWSGMVGMAMDGAGVVGSA